MSGRAPIGRCVICNHPQRAQIEADLMAGMKQHEIGKLYGISQSAVSRHKVGCIPHQVQKFRESDLATRGQTTIAEIVEHQRNAMTILEMAMKRANKPNADDVKMVNGKMQISMDYEWANTALKAIRESARLLEFKTKITGELVERKLVLSAEPQFLRFQSIVIEALKPYPEALDAVMNAVRGVVNAGE